MKLLHTADWNIDFFGYDQKEEHIFFLDWLEKMIKEQRVDIFDGPEPFS